MRFTRSEIGQIKWSSGGFAGEICPVCRQNRLVAVLEYPVCMRCRHKYYITLDLLKQLTVHRLLLAKEEIDWQQKPHPVIKGTIDNEVPWKATFVMGGWSVEIGGEAENRLALAQLIKQYLDSVTPAWLERARKRKTKIRRYFFMAAAGATMVTTAYLLNRFRKLREKAAKEAEEAEK